MTNLIIHDGVARDISNGVKWYREIDAELAECFKEVVYSAIEKAQITQCSS